MGRCLLYSVKPLPFRHEVCRTSNRIFRQTWKVHGNWIFRPNQARRSRFCWTGSSPGRPLRKRVYATSPVPPRTQKRSMPPKRGSFRERRSCSISARSRKSRRSRSTVSRLLCCGNLHNRTDVTTALKPGLNHIEIKVTNLWPNRIIGDQQPNAKRYTFTDVRAYQADSPLLESGLLGPVSIVAENIEQAHQR